MPLDRAFNRRLLNRGAWGVSIVAISFATGTSAPAQVGQRMDVTGHVAPRCWAEMPATGALVMAAGGWNLSTSPIRCNQSGLPVAITFREAPRGMPTVQWPSDRKARIGGPGSSPRRADLQIVVSPTL